MTEEKLKSITRILLRIVIICIVLSLILTAGLWIYRNNLADTGADRSPNIGIYS